MGDDPHRLLLASVVSPPDTTQGTTGRLGEPIGPQTGGAGSPGGGYGGRGRTGGVGGSIGKGGGSGALIGGPIGERGGLTGKAGGAGGPTGGAGGVGEPIGGAGCVGEPIGVAGGVGEPIGAAGGAGEPIGGPAGGVGVGGPPPDGGGDPVCKMGPVPMGVVGGPPGSVGPVGAGHEQSEIEPKIGRVGSGGVVEQQPDVQIGSEAGTAPVMAPKAPRGCLLGSPGVAIEVSR